MNKCEKAMTGFPTPDYREPFVCPFHNCMTDNGWCWVCAEETYGYEEAKRIYDLERRANKAKSEEIK